MADPVPPLDARQFLREHVAPRAAQRVAELRAEISRLERDLDERLGAEATVELVLEGPTPERVFMNLQGGEMRVAGGSTCVASRTSRVTRASAGVRHASSRIISNASHPPIDEPMTTCGPRQNPSNTARASSNQLPIVPAVKLPPDSP